MQPNYLAIGDRIIDLNAIETAEYTSISQSLALYMRSEHKQEFNYDEAKKIWSILEDASSRKANAMRFFDQAVS